MDWSLCILGKLFFFFFKKWWEKGKGLLKSMKQNLFLLYSVTKPDVRNWPAFLALNTDSTSGCGQTWKAGFNFMIRGSLSEVPCSLSSNNSKGFLYLFLIYWSPWQSVSKMKLVVTPLAYIKGGVWPQFIHSLLTEICFCCSLRYLLIFWSTCWSRSGPKC